MKCILWNVQWATAGSLRGRRVIARIADAQADVVCLTETTTGILPDTASTITSGADYGYQHNGLRRKVALWSASGWEAVDEAGDPYLPPGRFVSGVTNDIRFIGVCIPWRSAHVNTGRGDAVPWGEHRAYLQALGGVLTRYLAGPRPVCLLGDFNQRIPCSRQPRTVYDLLADTVLRRLKAPTASPHIPGGENLIDHIATGLGLQAAVAGLIPARGSDGLPFSDHAGVIAMLTSAPAYGTL